MIERRKRKKTRRKRKNKAIEIKNSEESRVFQLAKARIQQGATHKEPPAAYLKARKARDHR